MSQRIDLFTEDFALTSLKSGARSITLAIEAASPRERKVLNKNLTEEQILRAFDIAFRLGFTKIKIYNIANPPWEKQEDVDYYAVLAEKFDELKKKYNAKTQIRWSFTPFQAKNCTVFQWAAYKGIDIDEHGYPVFRKTLDSAYEAFKKYGQLMRVGTNSDISLVAQSLTYGDRRMANVIRRCYMNGTLSYSGGMGIGKNVVNDYTDVMREATGLGWDYFIREKDEDEVFAWDILDIGVKKSYFLETYKMAKEVANGPIDNDGALRPNCRDKCTLCGVCQNPKLPKFTRPKHELDTTDLSDIFNYEKPKKTAVLRVALDINPEYRYIHQSKLKMRIRKAFFNTPIKIKDNIILTTDKLLDKAWAAGLEIAEIYLKDFNIKESPEEIMKLVNEQADESFKIVKIEKYSRDITPLRDNFQAILYELDVPNEEMSYGEIKSCIEDNFTNVSNCIVKVKEAGMARDSIVSIEKNAKELCDDLWVVKADGYSKIFAICKENLSLYDLLPVVCKTVKRRFLKYPALIRDFVLTQDTAALDMFSGICSCCGKEIETNIWGEQVSEDYCLRHLYDNHD